MNGGTSFNSRLSQALALPSLITFYNEGFGCGEDETRSRELEEGL
jgi:hypothetical protein